MEPQPSARALKQARQIFQVWRMERRENATDEKLEVHQLLV